MTEKFHSKYYIDVYIVLSHAVIHKEKDVATILTVMVTLI